MHSRIDLLAMGLQSVKVSTSLKEFMRSWLKKISITGEDRHSEADHLMHWFSHTSYRMKPHGPPFYFIIAPPKLNNLAFFHFIFPSSLASGVSWLLWFELSWDFIFQLVSLLWVNVCRSLQTKQHFFVVKTSKQEHDDEVWWQGVVLFMRLKERKLIWRGM